MQNNTTTIIEHKTLGARITHELFENIKYTAMKNSLTQGKLLAQMYTSYKNKATAKEVLTLKEQEQHLKIAKTKHRIELAQRKLESSRQAKINDDIAQKRKETTAQRREMTALEAQNVIDTLSQELQTLTDTYTSSEVASQTEVN